MAKSSNRVYACAHCGSHEMQAGLNQYQCLACGECTFYDGTPVQSLTAAQKRGEL